MSDINCPCWGRFFSISFMGWNAGPLTVKIIIRPFPPALCFCLRGVKLLVWCQVTGQKAAAETDAQDVPPEPEEELCCEGD